MVRSRLFRDIIKNTFRILEIISAFFFSKNFEFFTEDGDEVCVFESGEESSLKLIIINVLQFQHVVCVLSTRGQRQASSVL